MGNIGPVIGLINCGDGPALTMALDPGGEHWKHGLSGVPRRCSLSPGNGRFFSNTFSTYMYMN